MEVQLATADATPEKLVTVQEVARSERDLVGLVVESVEKTERITIAKRHWNAEKIVVS
jgi:hypothetical protein